MSSHGIAELASEMLKADGEVKQLQELLDDAKAKLRLLKEQAIPEAMHELGITSLTLDSGQKVSIAQDVYASIPADRKIEAIEWLEKNEYAGIIKTMIKVNYDKDQRDDLYRLVDQLRQYGMDPTIEATVHPQTLKAFIRELMREGAAIPFDLFGATPIWTTRVTQK